MVLVDDDVVVVIVVHVIPGAYCFVRSFSLSLFFFGAFPTPDKDDDDEWMNDVRYMFFFSDCPIITMLVYETLKTFAALLSSTLASLPYCPF